MKIETLAKKAQEAMNKRGAKITVDGDWGSKSQAASENYEFKIEAIPDSVLALPDILAIVTEPKFVIVKGVSFKDRGNYQTPTGKFKGITVHSTISGRTAAVADSMVRYLQSEGFGCMVMDENGIIYIPENFDVFKTWGYHSGISKWKDITNVSDHFSGMEICNWGLNSKIGPYRDATVAQGYIVAGKYQ